MRSCRDGQLLNHIALGEPLGDSLPVLVVLMFSPVTYTLSLESETRMWNKICVRLKQPEYLDRIQHYLY